LDEEIWGSNSFFRSCVPPFGRIFSLLLAKRPSKCQLVSEVCPLSLLGKQSVEEMDFRRCPARRRPFLCILLLGHPALFRGTAWIDIIRIEIAPPMKENNKEKD
jgi:hypothetical protein